MRPDHELRDHIAATIDRARLVDTAVRLIDVPSPTGDAGAASDRLAEILRAEGFDVERPDGGHARSPAVVVRYSTGKPGRTLQFDGHLDTVHLPFVAAGVEDGLIRGSGASDMKGGLAAAIEALRVIRQADLLPAGAILLSAHDLHEAPWGDGRQLDQLIREGYKGDAVLIPEPLCATLPIVGRGSSTWKATIRRSGPPVHEVMRPLDEPSVLAAGARLVTQLAAWNERLAEPVDPLCGPASVFVGQFHGGEIYNQFPHDCWVQGTRRWLPGTNHAAVKAEFLDLLQQLARETKTQVDCDWFFIRDAFALDRNDPLVAAFQHAYSAHTGSALPIGGKPFVDDGNSFCSLGGIPAITHGPRAGGQHTVEEWVDLDDLVRVAGVYAMTAAAYCGGAR